MKRVIVLLFVCFLLQNCQKEEAPTASSAPIVAPAPVEVSLFNKRWSESVVDTKNSTYRFALSDEHGEYYKFFKSGEAIYKKFSPTSSDAPTGTCSGGQNSNDLSSGKITVTEQDGKTSFTTTVGNLTGKTWHVISLSSNTLEIKAEN
jgi:hypothetical protein